MDTLCIFYHENNCIFLIFTTTSSRDLKINKKLFTGAYLEIPCFRYTCFELNRYIFYDSLIVIILQLELIFTFAALKLSYKVLIVQTVQNVDLV